MEAALINALHCSGNEFGQRLYYWHGNLLFLTTIDQQCHSELLAYCQASLP